MDGFFNRRSLAAIVLFVMVWLALIPVKAQEPDRQTFMPALLESGTPVQDQFEDQVTARLYGFNGSEGDHINLVLQGEMDAYLVLFGSGGEFLAYNDDSDDAFGASAINDFILPYSGRYYVLATSWEHLDGIMTSSMTLDAPQEYEIAITGNTLPLNVDGLDPEVSVLTASVVESGQGATDELTAEQPIGFFSFEGQAGDQVDVLMETDDVRYPMLFVFAPDGSRIGLSNPMSDPLENLELPLDGQYLVMTMDAFFVDRLLPNAGNYGLGSVVVNVTTP